MTFNDLRAEVSALGFDTEIELGDTLISATRRAVASIYTEIPAYKTLSIYKNPIRAVKMRSLHHKGGDSERLTFFARAYSFRVFGSGSYKITDDAGERTVNFSGMGKTERGFLHGVGSIEFFGDYSYSVSDISFIEDIFTPSVSDIPILSGYTEYSVKDYAEDFLAFASMPTDEYGAVIKDSSVSSGKITVPDGYIGKINLTYKSVAPLPPTDADEEIILPDGCEHLLPLLVSAYVWLDDDSDKAQYYMALYREAISAIKAYDRMKIDTKYEDVNGWSAVGYGT